MQPRQLRALVKRWEAAEESREFMSAQIAWAIVNFSMSPTKKRLTTLDFMPSQQGKEKAHRQTRMRSRKVIAAELERVMESAMEYQRRQSRHA